MAHVSTTIKTKSNAQPKVAKPVAGSAKKITSVEKKIKKAVPAPKIKQTRVKPVDLKLKAKSRKSEKPAFVKKSNTTGVKKKTAASLPVVKPKSKAVQTKASAVKKVSIKSQAKDFPKKSRAVKSKKIEAQKKTASAQSTVLNKKKVSAKSLATVSAKNTNSIINKVAVKSVKAPVISPVKKTKSVKFPATIKAKKNVEFQPTAASKKTKSVKVQAEAPSKKLKAETAKLKEMTSAKTVKNKLSKIADNKKRKAKSVEEFGINIRKYSLLRKGKPRLQTERSKVAGKEIEQNTSNITAQTKNLTDKNLRLAKAIDDKKNEVKNAPLEPESVTSKLKKKKAKAIGAAVFRGKKERYDFEVFPIDAEFEDVPAIYIISKRKIDKRKRAHHALVCIGQTDSLIAELKKHRKGKCVKKFAANSISLLREENEKQRLKIEIDLKAAHAIPCAHT